MPILSGVNLLLCTLIICDVDTIFKFRTFSLEGKVSSNVAYFYGIPYSSPLIQKNIPHIFEKSKDIFDGKKLNGTFQSRINDKKLCLGKEGTPTDASLCLDFDLFVKSPVSGGDNRVECIRQTRPSFTFIWHVDILAKNRSAIKDEAIALAKESGALVVILYYRSGFLGFGNINTETTNLGFDDMKIAYVLIVHLSHEFCISTDKMVYSGNGDAASDLMLLSTQDYPYSGMYALFGGSFTFEKSHHSNQMSQLLKLVHCKDISCLSDKIMSTQYSIQHYDTFMSMGPWLPFVEEDRQPFENAPVLPVMYGINHFDGCSMVRRWYHGDYFPPTSKDHLIDAIMAVFSQTGIIRGQIDSAALEVLKFYLDCGVENYEEMFCRFIHSSFGMYDIWNSPFEALSEITFIGFSAACPSDGLSPLFPFSKDVDAWLRATLIKLLLSYVKYNSEYVNSKRWRFSRKKVPDSLMQNIGGNESTSSIVDPKEYQFQMLLRNQIFMSKAKARLGWRAIVAILFVCVVLILFGLLLYWQLKARKPKNSARAVGFEFPGLYLTHVNRPYHSKEDMTIRTVSGALP